MWRDMDQMEDVSAVAAAFDPDELARICTMPEEDFGDAFDLETYRVKGVKGGDDFFFHVQTGSDVLAVAHLDTVVGDWQRTASFAQTEAGLIVHSGALDDRLGAYTILDLLPRLGITCDVLLTVGEESGNSTAQYFDAEKQYNWMIEFDRGGTDVVMYQYDDEEVRSLVRAAGAKPESGIFSDIAFMGQLEIKGFNWGIGYRDYHGPRSHAYLEDTFSMVAKYVRFHKQNAGTYMPHYGEKDMWSRFGSYGSDKYDDYKFDDDGNYVEVVDPDEPDATDEASYRHWWEPEERAGGTDNQPFDIEQRIRY